MMLPYDEDRTSIILYNGGATTVHIAQRENCDTTHGFPIASGGTLSLSLKEGDDTTVELWVIGAGGSETIQIIESTTNRSV